MVGAARRARPSVFRKPATFCYQVSVNADAQDYRFASVAGVRSLRGGIYARFRIWREGTLPHASYQIAPAFWTVAGFKYAATVDPVIVAAVKRREPGITGLAYTGRAVYLVVVAGAATYEHIARLTHYRALMRRDPDYQEHRGKRVSAIVLCDSCGAAVRDFARRSRVRVIAKGAQERAEIDTRTDISSGMPVPTAPTNATKHFSP